MTIELVLADDHPIVLDGLEALFRLEDDFHIVAKVSGGEEALDAVREHQPDVLILDKRMPGIDGLEVLRRLAAEQLETQVVLLTAELDDDEVMEAVSLGVGAIVLKETAPKVLVRSVREVHAGRHWFDQQSIGRALERMIRREAGKRDAEAVLTPRELEIVRLVSTGLRNREIAERLYITEGTVKVHLHNIYEKLQVSGRLELTLYAQDKGLV